MSFCTNCGNQLLDNARFCPNCGSPVTENSEHFGTIKKENVPRNPNTEETQQPVVFPTEDRNEEENKKSRRKGKNKVLSIIAVVLALLGFNIDPPILTIAASIAAAVLGIIALKKKEKGKVLVIIAFVVAFLSLAYTFVFVKPSSYFSMPDKQQKTKLAEVIENQTVECGGLMFEISKDFVFQAEKTERTTLGVAPVEANFYYSKADDASIVFINIDCTLTDLNSVRMSDMETIADAFVSTFLPVNTRQNSTAGSVADCDCCTAEYEGTLNTGAEGYTKMAVIKNANAPSCVVFIVAGTEKHKEQTSSLFDSAIITVQKGTNQSTNGNNVSGMGNGNNIGNKLSGKQNADMREFLDSYEAFVDEYVAFMKKYSSNSSNVVTMLGEYLDMLTKLEELSEKANQYDTDKMTDEDAAYYLKVMNRCNEKMLTVTN